MKICRALQLKNNSIYLATHKLQVPIMWDINFIALLVLSNRSAGGFSFPGLPHR